MMKNLKQLLFVIALVGCVSASAFAQKEDKKPPPKERPPVIVVEPKKPKDEKPKDDNKKPQFMMYKSIVRYEG